MTDVIHEVRMAILLIIMLLTCKLVWQAKCDFEALELLYQKFAF